MQLITIGAKNQIVIPKEVRKNIFGLVPGRQVSVYSPDKQTVVLKVSSNDWIERAYGSKKDAWKNIDPIVELDKMRNEW